MNANSYFSKQVFLFTFLGDVFGTDRYCCHHKIGNKSLNNYRLSCMLAGLQRAWGCELNNMFSTHFSAPALFKLKQNRGPKAEQYST